MRTRWASPARVAQGGRRYFVESLDHRKTEGKSTIRFNCLVYTPYREDRPQDRANQPGKIRVVESGAWAHDPTEVPQPALAAGQDLPTTPLA